MRKYPRCGFFDPQASRVNMDGANAAKAYCSMHLVQVFTHFRQFQPEIPRERTENRLAYTFLRKLMFLGPAPLLIDVGNLILTGNSLVTDWDA